MAGLGQARRGSVGGVVPGGPPAGSIVDPVAERRRDATLLLRRRSHPVSRVIRWCVADGAILWLDQTGRARTSFVTDDHGRPSLSPPYHGFVV